MANAAGAAPGGHRNGFWGFLSLPGVIWLVLLFVIPFYAVAAVAFGQVDPILRTADPVWSPLAWNFSAMSNVIDRVLDPDDLGGAFIRTLAYVGGALVLCCVVGYPVAYYVARHARKWRGLLLVALVMPFWISYLMRMLAWVNLLQVDGYVNRVLGWLHLGGSRVWLNGDWPAVVIGLAYGYIPFFILPLYAALERLDGRLIEAGRDLGASPARVFQRVTLPLSMPGLIAASVITVLPMFGDYYTNSFLTSGSPRTEMIGNQIEFYLRGTSQPQTGASLVLILSAMLLVLMAYYLIVTVRCAEVGGDMRRNRPGRHAFGLAFVTWLYILWSLLPVLVAIRISFNSGKSRSTFQAPSWRWYFTDPIQSVWHDDTLRQPLKNTLKLAVLSMVITTPIGVMMAIGLQRWRGRLSKASNGLMLFPLVTPEIVMGVALFLVFTQVFTSVPRGFTTQLLGHITFSISYVVVIVRGRLAAIGPQYEEAARDLGANRMQAMRLVLLPLLGPAIFASVIVVFAGSIDDFVISSFLSTGASSETVPMRIYAGGRATATPALNALATIMLVFTLLVVGLAALVMRRMRSRQGGAEDAQLGNLAAVGG